MIGLFEQSRRYVVGIDPGETTGVAIMEESSAKFTELKSYSFWDFIIYLNSVLKARGDIRDKNNKIVGVYLHIENPNLNKPVFPIPSETEMFELALRQQDKELQQQALRMFSRRAQNIGMNKQMAKFLIEYADRQGFKVTEVRPKNKKVDAETFRTKTGFQGKTNQHSRDAALLIFPI